MPRQIPSKVLDLCSKYYVIFTYFWRKAGPSATFLTGTDPNVVGRISAQTKEKNVLATKHKTTTSLVSLCCCLATQVQFFWADEMAYGRRSHERQILNATSRFGPKLNSLWTFKSPKQPRIYLGVVPKVISVIKKNYSLRLELADKSIVYV